MNARQWLQDLHKTCRFASIERGATVPGQENKKPLIATNSEIQRWVEQGSVLFNGERVTKDEEIDFLIISVVLHPKSEKFRTTIW